MGMVKAVKLDVPVDDRGELFEILRRDEAGFQGFGQVYFVRSRQPGIVRGFHRHDAMWDHFCIVQGAAKFGFVDPQHTVCVNGCADGPVYWITLSDRCPARLDVPPGVWHGWMALEPNTLLLSVASEPYKGNNRAGVLDEERVPATTFGADWKVEAR